MELRELHRWERSLSDQIEALKKRRADIDTEIQQLSKKLELVKQMLTLEGHGSDRADMSPAATAEARTTPDKVREAAKGILADAKGPLHINEIHREFVDRGYVIPGGGTPFNILVHLVKSSGFVRVARGTYALAGTVPDGQVLEKQQRRPKRKKVSRSRDAKER